MTIPKISGSCWLSLRNWMNWLKVQEIPNESPCVSKNFQTKDLEFPNEFLQEPEKMLTGRVQTNFLMKFRGRTDRRTD